MSYRIVFVSALAVMMLELPGLGQLTLRVTVDTGFTEIVNDEPGAVTIDGYSVSSPAGQLGGAWTSLSSQGVVGWDEAANSDSRRRTEFNPTGASEIGPGTSLSLGTVFVPVAGANPDLAFQYTGPNGQTLLGDVDVAAALGLLVDRGTGEVSLFNRTGGLIDVDGYTIGSPSSSLGDGWQSFADRGVAGWDEADNSDASRVTEFNPAGSTIVGANESISLGTLYAPTEPTAIGQELPEDLTFGYTSPTGKSLEGSVAFSGARNNVVLSIDPESGRATIQNESPYFDVSIDAYTISSSSGLLNLGGWQSLESQGLEGWDAAENADAFRLTEFSPTSETALDGGGRTLDLGAAVDVSAGLDLADLNFEYLVAGGEAATGLIVLAEAASCVVPPGGIVGDFDGDGSVLFADFITLSVNFNQAVSTYQEGDANCSGQVDFADFILLSTNFGESAGQAAAVPEPGFLSLWLLPLLALRRRRK